jgi:hypothetical protein
LILIKNFPPNAGSSTGWKKGGEEKKMKKFNLGISTLLAVLLVILVAVLVGGGVWWYMNQKQTAATTTTTSATAISQKTTTTTSAGQDETAGWKTYTNNIFKFSLKYPSTYTIEDTLPKTSKIDNNANERLKISNISDNLQPRLLIYVNPAGFGPFFGDITYTIEVKSGKLEIAQRKIEPSTENNNDGEQFIRTNLFKAGLNEYIVHFIYKEGGADYESIFKEILATFQYSQ